MEGICWDSLVRCSSILAWCWASCPSSLEQLVAEVVWETTGDFGCLQVSTDREGKVSALLENLLIPAAGLKLIHEKCSSVISDRSMFLGSFYTPMSMVQNDILLGLWYHLMPGLLVGGAFLAFRCAIASHSDCHLYIESWHSTVGVWFLQFLPL